ncbi:glycosyl transferase [Mesorhizobium sp. L-8-10]|uniref:glycosyltransferase family 2 protein n=1 Tax=Mesorhizobium sp. L-8-10 TaxID=2744523 RepID=UPI0019279890|nr:glycosyl transferase [Mesorhizobium sp. L-8-10]
MSGRSNPVAAQCDPREGMPRHAHADRDHPLRASFIVCTRNRAAALEACLLSIEDASKARPQCHIEVVVVDNGSTDGTAQLLPRLADSSELPMTIVSEARRGLAAARNAGMARARGNILVFVDDDIRLSRHYLDDLERHYAEGDGCIIRGGRVELGDPADLPFTIKTSPATERFVRATHPGGFIQGCNMTMHREVAALVGSFDERFGAGAALHAAEDTDFLLRAHLLGIPVEYVPDMTVFHHHGRRTRRAIRSIYANYNIGNGGLYAKHCRSAPWLLRHLYWTGRSAWRESLGGPCFDEGLRLSYWPMVAMNLAGVLKFIALALLGRMAGNRLGQFRQGRARDSRPELRRTKDRSTSSKSAIDPDAGAGEVVIMEFDRRS